MAKANLTAQHLRTILDYDPDIGVFRWRERDSKYFRFAGKEAGHIDQHGYRRIFFHKIGAYASGRLAWLYMTGDYPLGCIDHINGDTLDNRWCNLRDVSHTGNIQNQRRPKKHNKSGFLGVTTMKSGFVSEIQRDGKRIYLGWFKTPEDAHAAYVAAKRLLHPTCSL